MVGIHVPVWLRWNRRIYVIPERAVSPWRMTDKMTATTTSTATMTSNLLSLIATRWMRQHAAVSRCPVHCVTTTNHSVQRRHVQYATRWPPVRSATGSVINSVRCSFRRRRWSVSSDVSKRRLRRCSNTLWRRIPSLLEHACDKIGLCRGGSRVFPESFWKNLTVKQCDRRPFESLDALLSAYFTEFWVDSKPAVPLYLRLVSFRFQTATCTIKRGRFAPYRVVPVTSHRKSPWRHTAWRHLRDSTANHTRCYANRRRSTSGRTWDYRRATGANVQQTSPHIRQAAADSRKVARQWYAAQIREALVVQFA